VRRPTRSRARDASFPVTMGRRTGTRGDARSRIVTAPAGSPAIVRNALLQGGCLQSLEESGVGVVGRGVLSEGGLWDEDLPGGRNYVL